MNVFCTNVLSVLSISFLMKTRKTANQTVLILFHFVLNVIINTLAQNALMATPYPPLIKPNVFIVTKTHHFWALIMTIVSRQ